MCFWNREGKYGDMWTYLRHLQRLIIVIPRRLEYTIGERGFSARSDFHSSLQVSAGLRVLYYGTNGPLVAHNMKQWTIASG